MPRWRRPRRCATSRSTSAAQEIGRKASGARVVKAFNTTFASTLVAGGVGGRPLDVFIASDDDEAKDTIRPLAEDGGLRAVDAGPLARAPRARGPRLPAHGRPGRLGTGYDTAVKVLS